MNNELEDFLDGLPERMRAIADLLPVCSPVIFDEKRYYVFGYGEGEDASGDMLILTPVPPGTPNSYDRAVANIIRVHIRHFAPWYCA